MSRVNQVSCPHCGTPMTSGRGVRVGRMVPCPRCRNFFTVPAGGGASGAWDPGRLLLAVFLLLLYLGGGAGLAYYSWTLNTQKPAPPPPAVAATTPNPVSSEPPAPPRTVPKPTVPLDPADDLQVDNAIIKGVWYLKNNQHDDGSWGANLPDNQGVPVGYTALPALALLECGVPADDPAIVKAAALVRDRAPKIEATAPYVTYQLALTILFLDRLGDARDRELIQLLALRLIAGQRADDWGWGYSCPAIDRKDLYGLLKSLGDEHISLDLWRGKALKGREYDPGRSDNSNTQFAVLALWAASQRYGVPIGRSIELVEQRFRTTQQEDGAWPYNPETGTGSSPWPTMTAAGLLGLAVAHGATADPAKQKQNPLDDANIKHGLESLGGAIDRSDEARATDLYFLWSVERVGVIYNLRTIGKEKKDWYAWGRRLLLAAQEADGHWQEGAYYDNNAIHNTCFALLFLKQANLAQELSDKFALLEKQEKK